MGKYSSFFKLEWQQALTYRAEGFVWFLFELIPLVVMLNLWHYQLVNNRVSHSQYSLLVLYYLVNILLNRLSAIHFEEGVIDKIKDGQLSLQLIKPYSYYWHLVPREITWRLQGLIYLLPSLVIIYPFLSGISWPSPTFANYSVFLILMVFAYFQRYFFAWLISLPAFWFDQSQALVHFKWMAEGIFGGAWIPLYLFPDWWQSIAKITPFYYWFYAPIQTLLGQEPSPYLTLSIAFVWLWVLYIFSRKFWIRAQKHYSAVGG